MNKLLKYWEANKRKILITIGVIALVFICIRIANQLVKQQNASKRNEIMQNSFSSAKDVTKPNDAIISDTKLDKQQTEENVEIIQNFVNLCNAGKIKEAYNLLSDDCKKNLFPSLDVFQKNYYNTIFNSNKTYKLELWLVYKDAYTYKVTYQDNNLLATGGASSKNFEDYISIVKQKNENKINIKNFILEEAINKKETINNIEININSRMIYKDYEMYNITIKNYTDKDILINDGQDSSNICLVDENDIEYISFINEIPLNHLILKSKYQRTIDIKFNKIYSESRKIEMIRFKNIILDYNRYLENPKDEIIEKVETSIKM